MNTTNNQPTADEIAVGLSATAEGSGASDTEYISIWGLLKNYVKDCELANNEKYMDSAWQRLKQLETDLKNAISNNLNYEINLQTNGKASNPYQLSQLADNQQTELSALRDQNTRLRGLCEEAAELLDGFPHWQKFVYDLRQAAKGEG